MWAKFLFSFTSGFAPLLWVAAALVFLSWQPFCPDCIYNLMLACMLLLVIAVSSVFSFYQVNRLLSKYLLLFLIFILIRFINVQNRKCKRLLYWTVSKILCPQSAMSFATETLSSFR